MAREDVIQGLIKRGLAPHVAEGIANEINRESGFDPGINEVSPIVPGSRGGFGLFQHTGPRRRELEAFAQARGVPVSDQDTQLDFALQELATTESRAGQSLSQTTTAEEAADVFKRQFLRPLSTQGGGGSGAVAGGSGADTLQESPVERLHRLYREGGGTPESRARYEAAFPEVVPTQQQTTAPQQGLTAQQLTPTIIDAYNRGDLSDVNTDIVTNILSGGRDLPAGARVIASTDDGGVVYAQPDGTQGFVGPALSTVDPETVARILEGATPAGAFRSGVNEQLIAQNPIAARAATAIQGVPFVGQFADEAIGLVSQEAQQATRAAQRAMAEERPGQTLGLQVAGGLAAAPAAIAAAGPAVLAAAPQSLGGQIVAGGGAGLVAGAIEGGVSGAGRGQTPEERASLAGQDAITGGIAGGVLSAAAPAVSAGLRNAADFIKSADIGVIARELGLSPDAARVVKNALSVEDIPAAQARLGAVGDQAMLADAGPATAQLLDTAMAEGGGALRVGREAIEARAAQSGPKLRSAFDAILGKPGGVKAAAREISQGSAKARRTAYNAAFEQPINYASPAGREIEGVLDRIPSQTLNRAVRDANDAMQIAGTRNQQILASIADDGTVTFTKPLNVQQLNEIKIQLGGIAEETKDQFGRLSREGIGASRLASDLRIALTDAVPTYGRAVRLGGNKIAEDNALSLGRGVLTQNVRLEDVVAQMEGASKAEKSAFKRGLREALEEGMSNVRSVASDQNLDAREVRQAIQSLSSRATRSKIEAAIGPQAANRISKLMEAEVPQLATRAAVSRGSATAVRQAGQEAVSEATTPGVLGTIARGEPVGAVRRITQVLTDTTPQADQARRAVLMQEIATSLTEVRGTNVTKALDAINEAIAGQPLSEAKSRMIANALAVTGSLAAFQAGTRAAQQPEKGSP